MKVAKNNALLLSFRLARPEGVRDSEGLPISGSDRFLLALQHLRFFVLPAAFIQFILKKPAFYPAVKKWDLSFCS